jgi:hypothetical protein
MLKARNSTYTTKFPIKCGTAQGDPLSMFIFCQCIDPIIEELSKEFDLIAYADDILIGLKDG